MDDLEKFILKGDERTVDAWFAEKGMGLDEVRLVDQQYIYTLDSYPQLVRFYTTDRGLRYVIEDRVRDSARWCEYTETVMLMSKTPTFLEVTDFAISISNRQVILAAARAMKLEYSPAQEEPV